jgi:class 3 adenylate cyclase
MSATGNLRSGERRNVTVLFADMKDFTRISEQMDPEEIDALMSQIFSSFESIVHRYEGTVEKYIGDALVAVFGVPTLHEDDPARAVGAALDYLDEIAALNCDRSDDAQIAFRIGITTGLITTGRRGEFDVVTGHAMAVASRIEAAAPLNAVLVSADARARCVDDFEFGDEITIQGKGIDEPISAFRVTGRTSGTADDTVPCVGRKQIVDQILRRFLRHDSSQTQGCILVGEPGIGKTRIAQEFVATVRQMPGFTAGVLHARARRYRSRPFSVVVDLLCDYFGIGQETPPERIAAIVTDDLGIEERTALGFARLITGETDDHDNQAFVILYLILKTVVVQMEEGPYSSLLCIDDLLYMDRSSLDFFQFYLRNADVRPFFLLMNRAVTEAIDPVFGDLQVIPVDPLGHDETMELIDVLVRDRKSGDEMSSEIRESIAERAHGNPLFIREYTRYALEHRDVQEIPSTVQTIFLTSLENYDQATRDLLKKLSVFALNFSPKDAERIQELTQSDPAMVRGALARFVRDGVLLEDGENLAFKYDLFKRALYDSLLNFNKKILHRIVADLMESRGDPHPMRLLHHLIRAEEYGRATTALEVSPHATTNVEYLHYIDQLLEAVTPEDADRYMRLLAKKSAILFNNGITEQVDSLLQGMIEMAITSANPLYAATANHLLTAYYSKAYCFGKARHCGNKAIAYYERAAAGGHEHSRYNVQNVLEIMASSELLRNNGDETERIMTRIRELGEQGADSQAHERYEITRAEQMLMRGDYSDALGKLEAIRPTISRESASHQQLHLMLGFGYLLTCRWQELVEVDQHILSGPSRHLANISQTHARLAAAYHHLGDRSESDRRIYQAEFSASQIRNDFDRVDALRSLATAYLLCGNEEKARQTATTGVGISLRHAITYPTMTLLMILVEIAATRDETDAAMFHLHEAELLLGSGRLLPARDTLFYHYYRTRFADDEAKRTTERDLAVRAFERELAAVGDTQRSALLEVRPFQRLHHDLG